MEVYGEYDITKRFFEKAIESKQLSIVLSTLEVLKYNIDCFYHGFEVNPFEINGDTKIGRCIHLFKLAKRPDLFYLMKEIPLK